METQSTSIEAFIERIKNYAETRIDLLRLKAIDKSSSFLSLFISIIVVLLVSFIFIIMLSIGIALIIGSLLGKLYLGFLIVAAFYLITGVVLYIFKDKWLKIPIANSMINNLMD